MSCEVFPAKRPASLSHGVPCNLLTKSARFCSVSGTRFTVLAVHTPNSFAKRCSSDSVVFPSHIPRTNLASPCLAPPRILPLGDTATRNSAASANFINSPCYVSRSYLQTLSSCRLSRGTFQATIQRVSPSTATHHGWSQTRFQLETRASNLTFHCATALAESWCHLDLELNSICARFHCDLVRQRPQRRFWINFQDCFRTRQPLDECCTHRCEIRTFIRL